MKEDSVRSQSDSFLRTSKGWSRLGARAGPTARVGGQCRVITSTEQQVGSDPEQNRQSKGPVEEEKREQASICGNILSHTSIEPFGHAQGVSRLAAHDDHDIPIIRIPQHCAGISKQLAEL